MKILPYKKQSSEDTSAEILKTRRSQLGLTQRQVATAADISLPQYNRFESGERTIEGASLRVALAVCAVLQLDPFIFLKEASSMNAYIDSLKMNQSFALDESKLLKIAQDACDQFNNELGTTYSLDNIRIAFCSADNIFKVYRDFTKEYGFHYENRSEAALFGELAEAFIGRTDCDDPSHVDGILIRTDIPMGKSAPTEYFTVFVHELAHIFCTTHEIPTAAKEGQRFYDLYCAEDPTDISGRIQNGQMNAGYAVWREFIADIIADIVFQQPTMFLHEVRPAIREYQKHMKVGNPDAKLALSKILSIVMNTKEGGETEKWEEFEKKLLKEKIPFISIFQIVFNQLHHKYCHEINPDFIKQLGTEYMSAVIQNSSPEDMMAFAETHKML